MRAVLEASRLRSRVSTLVRLRAKWAAAARIKEVGGRQAYGVDTTSSTLVQVAQCSPMAAPASCTAPFLNNES